VRTGAADVSSGPLLLRSVRFTVKMFVDARCDDSGWMSEDVAAKRTSATTLGSSASQRAVDRFHDDDELRYPGETVGGCAGGVVSAACHFDDPNTGVEIPEGMGQFGSGQLSSGGALGTVLAKRAGRVANSSTTKTTRPTTSARTQLKPEPSPRDATVTV
jgi:hypothetical protein